jgi:predicted RNA-binding Zn-ribbon protein involved in translation (DUF1610 family)
MFCPNCGAERIRRFSNNSPVADFGCESCAEEYELKSSQNPLIPANAGTQIVKRCRLAMARAFCS